MGHHDVNADGAHDSTRLPFRKCTRACTQCRRGIDAARPQSRVGVQPGSSAALLAAFRAASPTASPKAPPCSSPLDAASSVAGLPATQVFLTWCVGVTLQPLQRARATRTRFAARTALKMIPRTLARTLDPVPTHPRALCAHDQPNGWIPRWLHAQDSQRWQTLQRPSTTSTLRAVMTPCAPAGRRMIAGRARRPLPMTARNRRKRRRHSHRRLGAGWRVVRCG